MSALRISGLGVRYGDRVAVSGFDAELASGEWLCLIGPNGAGKSSVIRAIAGLVRAEGTIEVDGTSLADRSTRERAAMVAYVAQAPLLPDDMTGFDYVLLGRNPYIGYFAVESRSDRAIVHEALERLDLLDFADRRLGALSGGERQRLVIARALAQSAPILLLDEPTSALDIGHQQQVLELVDELRCERALTVVSSMHDLTLAGLYADRLALLHQGVITVSGPPDEVLDPVLLGEFYGANVTVQRQPDGTVVVVPHRSPNTPSPPA